MLRLLPSTRRLAPRQFIYDKIQGPVIGIDLGISNSRVAVMDSNKVKVIEHAGATRAIPSFVTIKEDGKFIVGEEAKCQAILNPENTLYATRRFIGHMYDDPEVQQFVPVSPYKIVNDENDKATFEVHGKVYSPQEITASIISKLKESAESYLGESVENVVITVPAHFYHSQIQATKEAFKLAGLNILRTIDESHAAALAYGYGGKNNKVIAVCDFGGGTFDISILHVQNGVIKVKSSSSDILLGGTDFDDRLMWYLVKAFKKNDWVNLANKPAAMQSLQKAAEKAKCDLSFAPETEILLPDITTRFLVPKDLSIKISREEYEKLMDDLFQRIKGSCQEALDKAKLKCSDIDEVLCVGRMSHLPKVQTMIRGVFARHPNTSVNPDEAVVMGAAIKGSALVGKLIDLVHREETSRESAHQSRAHNKRKKDLDESSETRKAKIKLGVHFKAMFYALMLVLYFECFFIPQIVKRLKEA